MNKDKGLLVVLSSPSGGGKTTVIKKIFEEKNPDYVYSISMTTRPIRKGEANGRDYWFVSFQEFEEILENDGFIEHEQVHDWHYGTPGKPILEWLQHGKTVLFDLDVFGALNIKKHFKEDALLIFLQPPSEQILLERLRKRSTESPQQIAKRLERVAQEMEKAKEFDVIIVNNNLNETIDKVKKAISEKQKRARLLNMEV